MNTILNNFKIQNNSLNLKKHKNLKFNIECQLYAMNNIFVNIFYLNNKSNICRGFKL